MNRTGTRTAAGEKVSLAPSQKTKRSLIPINSPNDHERTCLIPRSAGCPDNLATGTCTHTHTHTHTSGLEGLHDARSRRCRDAVGGSHLRAGCVGASVVRARVARRLALPRDAWCCRTSLPFCVVEGYSRWPCLHRPRERIYWARHALQQPRCRTSRCVPV